MWALFLKEIRSFLSSLTGYIVIIIFFAITGLFLWVIPSESNILDYGYANLDGLFIIQMLELYLDENDNYGFDIDDEDKIFYKAGNDRYYIDPEEKNNLLGYKVQPENCPVRKKIREFPFKLIYKKKNGEINLVKEEVEKMQKALEQIKKKDDILEVIYNLIAIAIDLQGICHLIQETNDQNVERYKKEVIDAYNKDFLTNLKNKLNKLSTNRNVTIKNIKKILSKLSNNLKDGVNCEDVKGFIGELNKLKQELL